MRLSCDRTGFPVIEADEIGLAASLLPVTKVQFERFLAEPNAYDNTWYEQVLAVNPRVSWRKFEMEQSAGLWLTGILSQEALAFTEWLGQGQARTFDLPSVKEWRELDSWMLNNPVNRLMLKHCARYHMHSAAREIVSRLLCNLNPQMWGDLALMHGGVAEWVRRTDAAKRDGPWRNPHRTDFGALGVPPHTCWDPQEEPLNTRSPDNRDARFGFRPICRLS